MGHCQAQARFALHESAHLCSSGNQAVGNREGSFHCGDTVRAPHARIPLARVHTWVQVVKRVFVSFGGGPNMEGRLCVHHEDAPRVQTVWRMVISCWRWCGMGLSGEENGPNSGESVGLAWKLLPVT
jgi:hypothetical protein